MKKSIIFCLSLFIAGVSFAQSDIVDVAMSSKNHTTLVKLIKASDLVQPLKGKGPFTVFAPTNEAFEKLPDGTVEALMKPENKEKLQAILKYHVVPNRLSSERVVRTIKEGKNKAMLTSLNDKGIGAVLEEGKVKLMDQSGNTATVTATDLEGKNGVIHVIDTVLMPQ